MLFFLILYGTIIFIPQALAVTWVDCNPMNQTCPNNPALGTSHNFVLNNSSIVNKFFNVTSGFLDYDTDNADFTVAKKADSPTIQAKFYIMFGIVSVLLKAAPGQGIISSIVLESDDMDEVDWNFLGGNGTHVETNFCGKGNKTSLDRAIYHSVSFDPRVDYHNYSIMWTSDKLEWRIDSNLIRVLPFAAANGGYNFPQTPMNLRLGIWAAGDKKNSPSTIEWAGGLTDFSKGPYSMKVKNTQITDFGSGREYQWEDQSGSWESIRPIPGNSTALKLIIKSQEPPSPSLIQRFTVLPPTTKLAIYCSVGAVAVLIFSAFTLICYRSRRKGRREREAYEAKLEKERKEASQDSTISYTKNVSGWSTQPSQKVGIEKPSEHEKPRTPRSNAIGEINNLTRTPPPIPKQDTPAVGRNHHSNPNNRERPYVLRNKSFSSRNPALYAQKSNSQTL